MSVGGQPAAEPRPAVAAQPAADVPDQAEIRAALSGNGDAYARLVARYQQPIAAYMWRFTRNRGQWEELVQDVFVEAYLSLAGYRARAPLLHWLRKIATRVGYRFWKGRARAAPPLPFQEWDKLVGPADADADAREAAELLHAALEQLGPRDRLVLTLFYLEGCQVAQIAELTGWSTTMVKVQTHRARGRLKKLMTQEEPES